MKFNRDPLVVEQNNYTIKIVNAYIVFELDTWPNNSLRNFILKNCLFEATKVVKNSGNTKLLCSGYWIAFDGAGSMIFGNDFARNAIFSV